jgi:hypothetical protein
MTPRIVDLRKLYYLIREIEWNPGRKSLEIIGFRLISRDEEKNPCFIR